MLKATRDIRKVARGSARRMIRTTEIYLRVDPSEKLEAGRGGCANWLASWPIQSARRVNHNRALRIIGKDG